MDTKNLDRTTSLADDVSTTRDGSQPFKRGHMRRSSYESAQIQLDFSRRGDRFATRTASLNAALNRAAAEVGSLALCDRMDSASCAGETTAATDSAIGDSVSSKRSSLDRRSEVSLADWEVTDEEPSCSKTVPQKKGISLRFPRSLFSRSKGEGRWRMFGDKKTDTSNGVVHTTGLILEERPSNLPQKSEEEAARHKALYEQILEQNKKREAREEKERKRALEEKKRMEEQSAAACRVWNEQILPNWSQMHDGKRCRELWWQGIPPKVRGRVWTLAISNPLNITEELYNICCERAVVRLSEASEQPENSPDESAWNRESSLAQIHLDVSRTFPNLGIFQNGGPYYDLLLRLLGSYAVYRPDVGYVQSMSFIAAVLLLQMDPFPAFVAFANLLNQPLQLAFFRLKQPQMTEYFIAFDLFFAQEIPSLHSHFDKIDLRPDLYLIEWIYTLFAKSLPLDVTCRVWDVLLRDGEEFVFKTALGILRMYEKELIVMDFDDGVQFLTKLPEKLSGAELFRNIEPFMRPYPANSETSKGRKRFTQIRNEVTERVNPSHSSYSLAESVNLGQISENVQSLKMSKSLSNFVTDLLKPQ